MYFIDLRTIEGQIYELLPHPNTIHRSTLVFSLVSLLSVLKNQNLALPFQLDPLPVDVRAEIDVVLVPDNGRKGNPSGNIAIQGQPFRILHGMFSIVQCTGFYGRRFRR